MKTVLIPLLALLLIGSPLSSAIAGDEICDGDKGGIDRDLDNDVICVLENLDPI